jgi:adenosine deaminase
MRLERGKDAEPHVRREAHVERHGIAPQPLDEVGIPGGGHAVRDPVRSEVVQGGAHLLGRTFLAGMHGEPEMETVSGLTEHDEVPLLLLALRAGQPEAGDRRVGVLNESNVGPGVVRAEVTLRVDDEPDLAPVADLGQAVTDGCPQRNGLHPVADVRHRGERRLGVQNALGSLLASECREDHGQIVGSPYEPAHGEVDPDEVSQVVERIRVPSFDETELTGIGSMAPSERQRSRGSDAALDVDVELNLGQRSQVVLGRQRHRSPQLYRGEWTSRNSTLIAARSGSRMMDAMDPDDTLTIAEALDLLPKVELHCHIEGTMRAKTLVELAARDGRTLRTTKPADLYRYDSLDGFLELFWLAQSCLAGRDDWARVAHESVVDGAAHGLVYRESFFTPARHLAVGQDLEDIVEGLEDGLAVGEQETGLTVMLICDMDRAFGGKAGVELVERLVELRRGGKAKRVIGLGMDSTESGIDPAEYADAYRLARASGLRLTAHQGENSRAWAIRYDVEVLGVERIDHGISILEDPAVAQLMVDRGIPITVCPLSNVRIANTVERLEDHPWPRMAAAGLHLTLNSDDPAFIRSHLGEEYAEVARAFDYDFDAMVAIALAGVDAAWLTGTEKAALRSRISTAAIELASSIGLPSAGGQLG